ncbi:MAG: two-component regulator propeller domain-containing protein, partial [Chitinophagales bacterium]
MRKKVSFADPLFFSLLLLVSSGYNTLAQNTPNAFTVNNLPESSAYNALSQNAGFKPFAAPGGIPMGFVTGVTQDTKGYMWFGATGLYRYDGYHLTSYKNDPLNPQSLGSNIIESICADKDGIIWIGTKGYGLDRFDPATGIFTHFRHSPQDPSSLIHNKVTVLFQDHEGFLWIGTHGGLDRLDIKTGKFYHYQHSDDPGSLSCDQVRSIYEDHEATIWIGTGSPFTNDDSGPDEGGLNRLDKKTSKFIRYMNDPHDPNTLINNKVGAIFEDSRGNFWVGTAGDGLHTMDRGKGIFKRHLYDPAHPEKLSRPPLLTNAPFDQIRFITEDAAGHIWIGTVLSGLNRYDPKTEKATYIGKVKTSSGYRDITGWCSYTSHEGVLWVGSWQEDLYNMDPLQKNIPFIATGYDVRAFYEDDKNVLWMGTSTGLIRYDRKTGITSHFLTDSLNVNNAGIYKDDYGTIWIGGYNVLYRYDKKTNDFASFRPGDKSTGSFRGGNIFIVTGSRNGSLVIGSDNGLDILDQKTGVFTHYGMNPEDTTSLSQNWVTTAHKDLWGNLWIGTYNGGGINLLNPQTGKFKHYLKGTSITSLAEDSDSILWAGTDGGFYRYSRSEDAFNLFTDPKGSVKTESIYVNSIVEDDKKNLWMSTSVGILRLDSKRNDIRIYGKNRGVNAGNLGLSSGNRAFNGALNFGAASGFYSFFPDSLSGNSMPPQIVFTNFYLGNESIGPASNSLLEAPLNEAKKIVLDHTQNIFSFDFAGIHYTSPGDNKHLFMLENYDNAWREAGSELTAYYHKVPPGRYIFRVKAASSEGEWTEKSITIIINPPWWLTWWAYVLYAILLLSLIYAVHRFQKQRVIQAER